MKRKIVYLLFAYVMLSFISCTSDRKANKTARKEADLRTEIIKMLGDFGGKKLSFIPKDTVLELDNETELVLWKNSFLNQDSSVFNGKTNINYRFTSNTSDLLFNQYEKRHSQFVDVMGVIKVEVADDRGNPLTLNPKFSTVLRFHPKLNMVTTSYFQYDSAKNEFSTPILFYENKVSKSKVVYNNETARDDIEIDKNYLNKGGSNTVSTKRHYKGQNLTKTEIIGYELTLKNLGFYYITRKNKEENLQSVSIDIQAKCNANPDWKKFKAFLFTNQNDYNYYLKAENLGDGRFQIIPAAGYSQVQLPLDNKYTLLLFGVDGEQSYFFKKILKLKETNNIEVKLQNVTFERLLKEIKEL
jgi:hypothetical protein